MQHAVRDGVAAAQRAHDGYRPQWHPLLAATETEPGVWHMVDERGCYGVIRMLRRGAELGYRAVTWAETSEGRQLIGYYRTLRAAAEATHQHYLREHGGRGRR